MAVAATTQDNLIDASDTFDSAYRTRRLDGLGAVYSEGDGEDDGDAAEEAGDY